jgi:hypothetical protein
VIVRCKDSAPHTGHLILVQQNGPVDLLCSRRRTGRAQEDEARYFIDKSGSAEKVLQVIHRAMLIATRAQLHQHPVHPQNRIASANKMDDRLSGITLLFELKLVDKDVHKTLKMKISCYSRQNLYSCVTLGGQIKVLREKAAQLSFWSPLFVYHPFHKQGLQLMGHST